MPCFHEPAVASGVGLAESGRRWNPETADCALWGPPHTSTTRRISFKGITGQVRMSLGSWVGVRPRRALSPVPVTVHSVCKRKPGKLELLELFICHVECRHQGETAGKRASVVTATCIREPCLLSLAGCLGPSLVPAPVSCCIPLQSQPARKPLNRPLYFVRHVLFSTLQPIFFLSTYFAYSPCTLILGPLCPACQSKHSGLSARGPGPLSVPFLFIPSLTGLVFHHIPMEHR